MSCQYNPSSAADDKKTAAPKDDAEAKWQAKLTPEQYRIARQGGTEAPFTGKYYKHKEEGTYACACCSAELFSSQTKFESGTGWPSFWDHMGTDSVAKRRDVSHGMQRDEVICKSCAAHLGHVFDDGPGPTSLRYCINSASLEFKKKPDDGKE